jgi:hypothetical protein
MNLISNTIMTYLLVKSLKKLALSHHSQFFHFKCLINSNLSGMCNVTGQPTNREPSSEYAIHHSNHEFEAVNVR